MKPAGNSIKGKNISLKNKEFTVVESINKKFSSISPLSEKEKKVLNLSKSSKTLLSTPVVFNSFSRPNQILTPTPLKSYQSGNERRASVCLKLSQVDSLARRSAFGGNSSREYSNSNKNFFGVSDLYSLNGNLLLGCTERNKSPDVENFKKKKKGLKKVKSGGKIKSSEIKLPKFAFEVKKIACQVKASKKKRLVIA
jgi:hypothetical protein